MADEKKIFTEWDNRFQCKLYSSKSVDQKPQNVMKKNSFPSKDKDFKRYRVFLKKVLYKREEKMQEKMKRT